MASRLLFTLTIPALIAVLLLASPTGYDEFRRELTSRLDSGSGADCASAQISDLRGVVFVDNVLSIRERGGTFHPPSDYVSESMRHIRMYGMNLVRVPIYWESYANNSAAFLDELDVVSQAADANGICVIFDNHHWYTTSAWGIKELADAEGRGFPSFVVKDFQVVHSEDEYASTAAPFWSAFLRNEISVGNRTVWDAQLDFFSLVIGRADKYDNVIGYEILNEPHLFNASQYDDLGRYHTYMAKGIREMSAKKIFFDRETTRGFQRISALEDRIVPQNVSGIVYSPHLYSAPLPGSQAEDQVTRFNNWSKSWGTEVLIGEWSASSQQESDSYLQSFRDNGFGWTYYSWRPIESKGRGVSLYDTTWAPMTDGLSQLVRSMDAAYTGVALSSAIAGPD